MAWPWLFGSPADDDDAGVSAAPAPPIVTESFAFGAPAVTDAVDAQVNLAVEFAVLAPGSVVGIDWTTPLGAPGVVPVVSLWNEDTATQLGSRTVPVISPGTVQRIMFAAAVAVVPGVNYQAQVWTDRYTATNMYPSWPVTTTHMRTATVNPGRFLYAGAPALATNTNTSCYFVSPVAAF